MNQMTNSVVKLVKDSSRAIPREQQLSVISSITMQMLDKAKNDDWQAVIELESKRTALIADFFRIPVAGGEAPAVAHYINKVLEIDKQLIELGNKQCHHLRESLQKINQGKRAMKVYTAN